MRPGSLAKCAYSEWISYTTNWLSDAVLEYNRGAVQQGVPVHWVFFWVCCERRHLRVTSDVGLLTTGQSRRGGRVKLSMCLSSLRAGN